MHVEYSVPIRVTHKLAILVRTFVHVRMCVQIMLLSGPPMMSSVLYMYDHYEIMKGKLFEARTVQVFNSISFNDHYLHA